MQAQQTPPKRRRCHAEEAAGPAASAPPPPCARRAGEDQPASRPRIGPEIDEADLHEALSHDADGAPWRGSSCPRSPPCPSRTSRPAGVSSCRSPRATDGPSPSSRSATPSRIEAGLNADGPEPTWRARFSMDVAPTGPVHAEVVLSRSRTRVTLWAEGEAARQALAGAQGELMAAPGRRVGRRGGGAGVRRAAAATRGSIGPACGSGIVEPRAQDIRGEDAAGGSPALRKAARAQRGRGGTRRDRPGHRRHRPQTRRAAAPRSGAGRTAVDHRTG